MPASTSFTSAPTASHNAATALANDSLVAKNALAAYFMVSAEAGSVMSTGASTPAYRPATRSATEASAAPTTTRSGLRKSCTADPWRRNSGLETTATSARPRACCSISVVPAGAVDLFTTTAPGARLGPISEAAASR